MGTTTFAVRRIEARRWIGAMLVALICSESRVGSAAPDSDSKKTCAEGYENYQVLRKESELKAAQRALLQCVKAECPSAVQRECSDWMAELARVMPSVVLEATVDGAERTDVAVEMDGRPLTDRLDGKAVDVDPGSHTFRFHHGALPVVEKVVLLKEGDKLRVVSAALGKAPPPASQVDGRPQPNVPMHRPVPAVAYVLGGVSLLSFGSFAAFALMGKAKESDIRATNCQPFCADVDSVRKQYLIADISLGVGIVSAIASGIVVLARPSRPIESASTTVSAVPMGLGLGPTATGGVHATWVGSF